MDQYEKLKEAGYVGNDRGQGENDYRDGGVFYRLFSAATKKKLCYTIDKKGKLGGELTFKRFHDT